MDEQTYEFHIWPRKPGAGFCSSKLALRALADMSAELRFWFRRPEKRSPVELPEDCRERECQDEANR